MDLKNRTVVVTGGANGIGASLCRKFHQAGAAHVAVVDRDEAAAQLVASEVGGSAHTCDVANSGDLKALVEEIRTAQGSIDLFASNAGTTCVGGVEVEDDEWLRQWNVNVMAHVWAARALLPMFLKQGHGYFLQTVSAAGIMTEVGSAPYSVTKHAAIALAEWLSVNYRRKGIGVSVLCPAGVKTDFLDLEDPVHQFLNVSAVSPDEVADVALEAVLNEQFLVLPSEHEPVREFFAYKGTDYDRWLHNYSRIAQRLERAREKARKTA